MSKGGYKVSLDEMQGWIDELKQPKPAAPATVGIGDLRVSDKEPTIDPGQSFSDFRKLERDYRVPVAGLDYEIPQAPYQAQFDHLKNLSDPTMATGTESEWWNPVTPEKQPIVATSFSRAVYNTAAGMAGGLRMLGAEDTGKAIADKLDGIASSLPQTDGELALSKKKTEFSDALTPEFYTDGRATAILSSAAGASFAFMVGSALVATVVPASATAWTTAKISALGRAALSTPAGRATLGKIVQNPKVQQIYANTLGKIGDYGKAYILTRTAASAPESLTEGGGSYNTMMRWNEDVAIIKNPNISAAEKTEAKSRIRQIYQQEGGQGEPDFDHLPTIDDAKTRAWKQTMANLPLLVSSNALEGVNLFTPAKGLVLGTARKGITNSLIQGGEELGQSAIETGISGVGTHGTPVQGEGFVWSLNPAEWSSETKQNVMGGLGFGLATGGVGGQSKVKLKNGQVVTEKVEPGVINKIFNKQPNEQAEPAQPAAQPEQTKLKIGEIIPDSENQDVVMRFEGLKPDGENIGSREGVFTLVDTNGNPILNEDGSPRRVVYDLPISVVDKSVGYFDENAKAQTPRQAEEFASDAKYATMDYEKSTNQFIDTKNKLSMLEQKRTELQQELAQNPSENTKKLLYTIEDQIKLATKDLKALIAAELIAPIAPENNHAPANPGAKPPETSNINTPLQDVPVGPATWHSSDGDISINITGLAGEKDGVQYVNVEGSSTAIPLNEISPVNVKPEKHEVDPAPVLAPNKNWKIDPGAMPGEPEMFFGVKNGDFETATAAIRQVVDDQGKALWESMLGDGTVVGQFSSSAEAAAAAEKAMQNVPTNISPKEKSTFAVGDKVTSSKGAGVVSIVTKTGIGVKTADGKKFSVSWDNVEKFGLKKEDSSDGVPASGKSSVSTGTSVDILNDIAAGNSDKIKIGDTVTRPGKNDGFVVMDDSDPSMFVVKTKQGGTVKTGKKGVVKSGSAADVATVDPNQKQKDAFATASRSFEEASKLSEQAKTDSSIENPWPEVIELLKETLHAQNVGDARIDEQARKMMREAEKAAAAFGSEPEPVEAANHSVGDKVTVSGEKGEATVTAVQGDNVVVEMDNVGVTGTKTTTVPAKDAVTIDTPESKYRKAIKYDKADGETKAKYDMNFTHIKNILDEKDSYKKYAGLRDSFISNDNKRWMAAYDAITGETIPRKQGERLQYLQDKYPEEHKRLMAAKADKRAKSDAEMRRARINGTKVNHDGKVIGRADFIDSAIEDGYRRAIKRPQGAAFVYHLMGDNGKGYVLANKEEFIYASEKIDEINDAAIPDDPEVDALFESPAEVPAIDKNEEKSDNVVENNNGFDERRLASVKDTIKSFSKFKKPVNVIDSSPEAIAAYEREMKAELDKLGANIVFNPSLMGAALKLGIAHAQNGVNNFAEWSAKMISSVGEKIRPYLPSTWQMINTFPEGETYNPDLVGALFEYAGIKSQTGVNGYDALRKSISEDFGAEFEPYAKMVYAGITSWKEAATSEHRSEGATDNRLPEAVPPEETEGRRSTGDNKADSDTAGENLGNNNEPASGTAASPETRPDAEVSARPEHGQRGSAKPNVGKRKAGVRNQNYVITDKDQLGKGGPVQKFNDNIAAIKLIKKLNEENRQATPEEKAVLVRYVGWGGFPQLFDSYLRPDSDWYSRSKELKELLSSEEYTAARASTTNAHYTSETVVRAIWDGVKRLGFTGGKVLEPSMGTGNFFGMIPKEFQNSSLTGVELDPLTGAIAKQLYQDASVHVTGFEKAPLPEEYYDLAISNVPFGDYTLHDPKYNKYKLNIHNYFFVKALDKVRPGGLVVFVTGTGTMQSDRQKAVRSMIAGKAELLGAIKMPNTAFKENARTEVTTDVLFLRKLMPDEAPAGHAWGELAETGIRSTYNYRDMQVNEYFVKNPDMMLGELYEDKLHPGRLGLKDNGKDLGDMMKKAIAKLPKGIYAQSAVKTPTAMDISKMIDAPGTAREGSVQIQDGKVHIVTSGKMVPKDLDAKRVKAVSAIVSIREQVRELMRAQLDPSTSDDVLTHRRATLKKSYEQYFKEHGYLAASKNKSLFDDDPDSGLVFALEQYPDKKSAPVLSDIFTTRTIQPYRRATEVSTPEEALIASLQETGRVDIERMSALLSKPEEAIIQELEGQIFHDPTSGKWEQRELYLSGNVRQKLVAAREAAKADKKYSINVSELESVQPTDLEPHEIKAKLGSPWIPASDIEKFIDHIVGTNNFVSVKHDDLSNTWLFNESNARSWQRPDNTRNYQTWGTSRYSAVDLIEAILNSRQITVKDKDIDGKPYVNDKETAAAQDKAENIKKEFNEWVWKDKERSERLAREYNDNFNAVRLPEYNGEHLQIPGLTTRIELRPHQKNAIWRIIQGGNSLIAHGVGLGKTLVMQAAGMKLRQLGLSRKPLYVLPNATISDFETKFREHFPAAKILVLSSKTLPPEVAVMKKESGPTTKTTKEGVILERYDVIKNAGPVKPAIDNAKTAERIQARRAILSRIATEDWDAVLITHNMFTRLPMSPRIMAEHIKQIISDYYAAIESAKAESGNSKWVKDLEKQVKRWEAELEAALSADTKSIVTPFDELGIDYLFVDEADVFKNLGFATKMGRIAGVQNGNAKRSFDMYAKTSYLNKANRGSGVVFATGTPISNTIGEMFTMMRYLIPQRLRELNIGHFDTWAANFGETIASFERDVAGKGYRTVERFAKFVNAPELIRLFREFADVKRAEDVNLPLPTLRTGSWQTVVSPMSDALKNYIDTDITSRVNAIRSGAVKPDDDNMLVVTSDLRKAALDIRLVLPGVRLAADSKINKAVDNIFRIWSETKEKRSTQIVFCDISIPKAEKEEVSEEIESDDFEIEAVDASVYQTIQRMLVDKGVPKEEIVFIHDAKNNKQKQALFNKMNSGEVRVLIGSTGKAGVGLNVQKKLVAAHHLDVPWRPRDLEQRNGRIVRQGNENEEVDVFAYATEGSADSLMWERVAMKQRFIQHAMSDNLTDREIVEDDLALGFAEISAITSGNPLLAEKVKLENQVTRLRLLREKHESDKLGYRIKLERTLPHDIKKAKEGIAKVEKDIAARKDTSGDKFSVEINGKAFTDRKAAEDALNGFIEENTYSAKSGDESVSFVSPDMIDKEIGFIGGMRIITRKTGDDHHMYTITKKTGESLEVQKGQIRLVLKGPSDRTYPVTTPTINGIENRLRRIDDFLKEAQTELNNLESSKAEIQKLIDKPFDREAEYQKLNSRLDDVLKELAETDKPKETDVQLNSGIDPFQLIPGLRKYSDMAAKEAFNDLVAIGRKVFEETSHGGKWMARMKELLGDLWGKAKSVMGKVWNEVKRIAKDNTGAISMSPGAKKDAANFARQLDEYVSGVFPRRATITIGKTPEVFLRLGKSDLPMVITQDAVEKILNPIGDGMGKHDIPLDVLKQLPQNIHSPIMVFDSATSDGSFVAITELKNKQGKTVVAAVHFDKTMQRHVVNSIASVYGKDNEKSFVMKELGSNRLRFMDKEKTRGWFQSGGLQLPTEGTNYESNQNVLHDTDVVKSQSVKRLRDGESPVPILVELGTVLYNEGKTASTPWLRSMRDALGDQWKKFQHLMVKVWNEVKKAVSSNRGAIRLGGREIEAKRVYVPPGADQTLAKTLEDYGWKKRVAADGTTVLKKPEPQEKEIPDSFEPVIPGMDRSVAYEFEKSSDVPEIPTKEKVRDGLNKMWAYASRKYITLPRTAQFAPLEFGLTQLEHKKGVATDTTVKIISKITDTLKNPKDYKLFSHKVVFDDIAADLSADPAYEMPFGLTADNFQEQYDAVNAAITPEVQEAVDARKEAWTSFKNDYVAAMKAIGFNVEDRLKKGDTYFHHIVLDYAELKKRLDPVLGSQLRTPNYRGFLKGREGSTKNILTDYLQPEMEVMGQMMYDVEIAKVIKMVAEKYDIMGDLKRIAVATNEYNTINGLIDEMGEVDGLKEWRSLSKKQAMAMQRLGQAAFNDELPDGGGKYSALLDALAENYQAGQISSDSETASISKDEMFAYLNYLIKQDGEGKMIAGLMFKGLSEKAKAIKERLGDEHLSWRDLIPEGYDTWQPREGNIFYTGFSIPEHIAQTIAEKAMQEIGVPADQVRRAILQGGRRRELVVPVEVSATLEEIVPAHAYRSWIANALTHLQGKWKQAVLQMPTRFMSYNFNNMVGDLDAVVAAQGTKAMKKTMTAARELYGVFYRGKEMSPHMQEWFNRGGVETLLQTQEAGKVNQLATFDRLMEREKKLSKLPLRVWQSYWQGVRKATDFREAIMRYAKFLDYVEQMNDNDGKPKEFGASDPASVMALEDKYDRAFKLSNELLGAYDSISEMGRDMRSFIWPFWSWIEVNFTRYVQMIKNSIADSNMAADVATTIGGNALRRAPFAAVKAGAFMVRATYLWAILQIYNWWMWPEEERELADNVKYKMHIILGRDQDGKVLYVKVGGAFADLLGWVALDTPMQHYDAWLSGRKSLKEIAVDMAMGIPNKFASGITPYFKVAAEMIYGKSVFPDMRNQIPIRDKGLYLASAIALGNEYRAVFGLPSRPYTPIDWSMVKKSDPLQAAYYSFMGTKQRFMESKGKGEGFFNSPKSEALRNYKEALRYQDEQAAVKYLEEYKLAGGTREGIERSMESMNPTAGLKVSERKEFLASLHPEDRRKMAMAQQYFDMVIARSGGALSVTKKGVIDVKLKGVDLPSEKKPKKQNFF